jgi:DNA-binding winged helix-turn-helix (wHTH) protein/TolB-like protein
MDERTDIGAIEAESAEPRLLCFDGFRVDPPARVLWRGREPVPLTPRAFSVLLVLLEQPGQVVTKDELLRRLWPRGGAEASLTQCISALRKALGESAGDRRYVVTVPGRGYSFAVDVVTEAPPAVREKPGNARSAAPSSGYRMKRRLFESLAAILFAASLFAAGFVAWAVLARETPVPAAVKPDAAVPVGRQTLAVLGFRNLSGQKSAEWLASALPEMLTTELAGARRLRVVPSEALVRLRPETLGETLDGQALARVHSAVGADLVVAGSFVALGEPPERRVRLDVRVVQVKSGETLASLAVVGREKDLFDLVSRAGARLQDALGVSGPPPAGPPPAR